MSPSVSSPLLSAPATKEAYSRRAPAKSLPFLFFPNENLAIYDFLEELSASLAEIF